MTAPVVRIYSHKCIDNCIAAKHYSSIHCMCSSAHCTHVNRQLVLYDITAASTVYMSIGNMTLYSITATITMYVIMQSDTVGHYISNHCIYVNMQYDAVEMQQCVNAHLDCVGVLDIMMYQHIAIEVCACTCS